eukprot:gnl/Chilomastix_cuspidata/1235.p1 GENE.gnl/Chilomastix_cuspidata/1235~~gnl/Chilomastix_cuspidata/1235.p1  ORF type:complete len:1229 (+),score=129.49 gnl/Chilomastix_cuspidata/1235:58-3687(+)
MNCRTPRIQKTGLFIRTPSSAKNSDEQGKLPSLQYVASPVSATNERFSSTTISFKRLPYISPLHRDTSSTDKLFSKLSPSSTSPTFLSVASTESLSCYSNMSKQFWRIERAGSPPRKHRRDFYKDDQGWFKLVYPSKLPVHKSELNWLEEQFSKWNFGKIASDEQPLVTIFNFIDEVGRHILARSIGEPENSSIRRFGKFIRQLVSSGRGATSSFCQRLDNHQAELSRIRENYERTIKDLKRLACCSTEPKQSTVCEALELSAPLSAEPSDNSKPSTDLQCSLQWEVDRLRARVQSLERQLKESFMISKKKTRTHKRRHHTRSKSNISQRPPNILIPSESSQASQTRPAVSAFEYYSSNETDKYPSPSIRRKRRYSVQFNTDMLSESSHPGNATQNIIPLDFEKEQPHVLIDNTPRPFGSEFPSMTSETVRGSPEPISQTAIYMGTFDRTLTHTAPSDILSSPKASHALPSLDFAIAEERRMLKILEKVQLKKKKNDMKQQLKQQRLDQETELQEVFPTLTPNPLCVLPLKKKAREYQKAMLDKRNALLAQRCFEEEPGQGFSGMGERVRSLLLQSRKSETFDHFVVDLSSNSAFCNLTSIANSHAFSFNPLLLYTADDLGISKSSALYNIAARTRKDVIKFIKTPSHGEESDPPTLPSSEKLSAISAFFEKQKDISISDTVLVSSEILVQAVGFYDLRALHSLPCVTFSKFVYMVFLRQADGSTTLCNKLLASFLLSLNHFSKLSIVFHTRRRKKTGSGNFQIPCVSSLNKAKILSPSQKMLPFDRLLLLVQFLLNDAFTKNEVSFLLLVFSSLMFFVTPVCLEHPWIDMFRVAQAVGHVFRLFPEDFRAHFLKELFSFSVVVLDGTKARVVDYPHVDLHKYKIDIGIVLWSFLFKFHAVREASISAMCKTLTSWRDHALSETDTSIPMSQAIVTPSTPISLKMMCALFRDILPRTVNVTEAIFETFSLAAFSAEVQGQNVTVRHFFDVLSVHSLPYIDCRGVGAIFDAPLLFPFRPCYPSAHAQSGLRSLHPRRAQELLAGPTGLVAMAKKIQTSIRDVLGLLLQESAGSSLARPLLPYIWTTGALCSSVDAAVEARDPISIIGTLRSLLYLSIRGLHSLPTFLPQEASTELVCADLQGGLTLLQEHLARAQRARAARPPETHLRYPLTYSTPHSGVSIRLKQTPVLNTEFAARPSLRALLAGAQMP